MDNFHQYGELILLKPVITEKLLDLTLNMILHINILSNGLGNVFEMTEVKMSAEH
jgi:hypothetical protein